MYFGKACNVDSTLAHVDNDKDIHKDKDKDDFQEENSHKHSYYVLR